MFKQRGELKDSLKNIKVENDFVQGSVSREKELS